MGLDFVYKIWTHIRVAVFTADTRSFFSCFSDLMDLRCRVRDTAKTRVEGKVDANSTLQLNYGSVAGRYHGHEFLLLRTHTCRLSNFVIVTMLLIVLLILPTGKGR